VRDDLPPTNAFAAMFDIIGFRGLRQREGTTGLYRWFVRGILPGIQHSAAGRGKSGRVKGRSVYMPDFCGLSVQYRHISDSVIFFTRDDSFQSFLNIVHSSCMLLQFGFNGGKAPYRGAIGWGDLIATKDILLGTAIEDAYVGESSQAWAGAMLTKACLEFADANNYIHWFKISYALAATQTPDEGERRKISDSGSRLVQYDVPIQINPKDGPVSYSTLRTYALDWTIRMYEGAAAQSFDDSDSSHARRIAANTVAFVKWARTHNRLVQPIEPAA
jgi:hypothetical protein